MDDETQAGETREAPAVDEALLPQLMAVLTARWRQENGRLAIGVPRRRLLEALRIDDESFEFLLHKLADKAAVLGLELRDYRRGGDTWLCLTAVHGGPSELLDREQGVLGLLIHRTPGGEVDGAVGVHRRTGLDVLPQHVPRDGPASTFR